METYLLLSVLIAIGTGLYLFFDITTEACSALCWYFHRKTITSQVVTDVIFFARNILQQEGIHTLPSYRLSLEPSKYKGSFDGFLIVIYVHNQTCLNELVETVLHEIAHFIQKHKNAIEFAQYDEYAREFGYRKNPLEIEAQKFARLWRRPCVEYLYAKGVISRTLV